MATKVSDSLKTQVARKQALGDAVRQWISESKNVKSIKVKFGSNQKAKKEKK